MQIGSTLIQKTVTQPMVKTPLSHAVAGNRPLGAIGEINPINPSVTTIVNHHTSSSAQSFEQDIEKNLLSQNEIEQTVAESGLFEFSGKIPQFDIVTNTADHESAKLQYDTELEMNRGAIQMYMMTQHADRRDEIQQMVGIDLYV